MTPPSHLPSAASRAPLTGYDSLPLSIYCIRSVNKFIYFIAHVLLYLLFKRYHPQPVVACFFFLFLLPALRLYATRWVMTDLRRLYITWLTRLYALCSFHFCFTSPLQVGATFGFPILSLSKKIFTFLVVFPFPLQPPLPCPFSSSYPCCLQKL